MTRKCLRFVFCVAFAAALVSLPAEAKPRKIPVSAIGSGTEAAKSSAEEYAKNNAELGLVCIGTLENIKTRVTACNKIGEGEHAKYFCTAIANATCVIGS